MNAFNSTQWVEHAHAFAFQTICKETLELLFSDTIQPDHLKQKPKRTTLKVSSRVNYPDHREEEAADEETPKPPPSIARGLRSRSTSKTEPNGNQAQPATPRSSRSKPEFPPLKQIPSSPSQQRLRSSGAVNPAERATPSPRALRKTRRHAYGGSVEPSEEAKDSLEHA